MAPVNPPRTSDGKLWFGKDGETCYCELQLGGRAILLRAQPQLPLANLLESIAQEVPGEAPPTIAATWTPRGLDADRSQTSNPTIQWARSTPLETVVDAVQSDAAAAGDPSGRLTLQMDGKSLEVAVASAAERLAPIEAELAALLKQLEPLEQIKRSIDALGESAAARMAWAGLFGLLLQWGTLFRLTFYELSWDVIEPISYFLTFGTAIVGYVFYLFTRREYSFEALGNVTVSRAQARQYRKHAFPLSKYQQLVAQRERLVQQKSLIEQRLGVTAFKPQDFTSGGRRPKDSDRPTDATAAVPPGIRG